MRTQKTVEKIEKLLDELSEELEYEFEEDDDASEKLKKVEEFKNYILNSLKEGAKKDLKDYELTDEQIERFEAIKKCEGSPYDYYELVVGHSEDEIHYYITIEGNEVYIEVEGKDVPPIDHPVQSREWRETDDAGPWSADTKFTIPECENEEEFKKCFWSTITEIDANDFDADNEYFEEIYEFYFGDIWYY